MKRIIVTKPAEPIGEVKLEKMFEKEIVVYRSFNSDNYCILTKLVQIDSMLYKETKGNATTFKHRQLNIPYRYGFVPLNRSDCSPRFVANEWHQCIEMAEVNGREVYTFKTMREMLEALYLERI